MNNTDTTDTTTITAKPPVSMPGDKCSCCPGKGDNVERYKSDKCTNVVAVWLVDDKGELMIHSGPICQSCADRILDEWNTAFPDEAWSTVPIVAYVHPFAISPAKTVTIEPINVTNPEDGSGFYLKVDDVIVAREWLRVNLEEDYNGLSADLAKATRRREAAKELITAREESRHLSPQSYCELGDHEDVPSRIYSLDWLNVRVCVECYIGHLRLYYPETSIAVIQHMQQAHGLFVDRVSPWQPTECANGSDGSVHWRVFRSIVSASSGKSREYGKTDAKGILEFVNREQAQGVCDVWNSGDNEDETKTTPGSTYVFDDGNTVKVRKAAAVSKPINTSRLVGLFATAKKD